MNQRKSWTKTILAAAAGVCVLGFASHSLAAQPGIRCVQNQLNALGFDSGYPDGSIGPLTRQAAEQYRTWMAGGAGGDAWSFPALTALNGQLWCEGIAADHPEVAKFATEETDSVYFTASERKGLVATFNVPVSGRITGWEFSFSYKTECENDHYVSLTSPSGRKMVLMDRGLGRCSGTPTVMGSEQNDPGPFKGTRANGKWQLVFRDLDANAHSGSLEKVRMTLFITNGGVVTEHVVDFDGLPRQVPNPS